MHKEAKNMDLKRFNEQFMDVFERVWKPWLMLFGEELARLLVSFMAVWGLNALLMTGVKGAWSLYGETSVGDYFRSHFLDLSRQLDILTARPFFDFVTDVTLTAFLFIVVSAILMQFLYVRHYLYAPLPWYGKLAWIAGLTFFVADEVQAYANLSEWTMSYMVALPSVLCFLPVCLTVASHVIPDLTTTVVRSIEWFSDKLLN